MGKKNIKPRMIPEQDGRIIGAICFCQMTLVLSAVALVYLSVAIYAPSHKAFHSGFDPTPVMCETVNTSMNNNCSWVSCGEWCLTRTSGFCPQMHVTVRNNGSRLLLTNCTTPVPSVTCPPTDLHSLPKRNCNNLKVKQCNTIEGHYNCSLGHCVEVSELLDCVYEREKIISIDVDRNSGKLTGQYWLDGNDKAYKIKRIYSCERKCKAITTNRSLNPNVIMSVGNTAHVFSCKKGFGGSDPPSGELPTVPRAPIWDEKDGVLLVSCLSVETSNDTVSAIDCVNGTRLPIEQLPEPNMNFTDLRILWEKALNSNNSKFRSHGGAQLLPPSKDIQIFPNPSRLYINLDGCVNTLRGECKQFLQDYGFDGKEYSARSRYPCFVNRNDSFLVLARFDLEQTWKELLIAVTVPTILFVISLATLCVINRSVKVGDDAKLRCLSCCRKQKVTQPTQT